MKHFIFLLGILFLFSACSNPEDDNGSSNNDSLIGNWELIERTYFEDNGQVYQEDISSFDEWWEFHNNYFIVHTKNTEEQLRETKISYTFNKNTKELTALGLIHSITELTSKYMTITSAHTFREYWIIRLKRK